MPHGVVGLVLAQLLEQAPRAVVGQECGEAPVVCHGESVADDGLRGDRHACRKLGEQRVRRFLQLLLEVLVEEIAVGVEARWRMAYCHLRVDNARTRGREHLPQLGLRPDRAERTVLAPITATGLFASAASPRGRDSQSTAFLSWPCTDATHEAEAVVRALLAEHGVEAQISVDRWHDLEQRWEDESVPLPQTEAEREAERERLEQTEEAESRASGRALWEVRMELPSHGSTRELADRLEADGLHVIRRWTFLLVGADSEDDARELAERLRDEAPDAAVHVEPSPPDTIAEVAPGNPFAIFGGLAGYKPARIITDTTPGRGRSLPSLREFLSVVSDLGRWSKRGTHGSRARTEARGGVRGDVPVRLHGRHGDEQGGRRSARTAGDRVGPDGDDLAGGHVSGGHFNPAVSLACFCADVARRRLRALHDCPVCRRRRRRCIVLSPESATGHAFRRDRPGRIVVEFIFTFALV